MSSIKGSAVLFKPSSWLLICLMSFLLCTLSNNVLGDTYSVYSWGLNSDGQTGLDFPTSGFTSSYNNPVLNQYLSSLLANPNSLYETIYSGQTKPADISISLKTIIPGYKYNLYWFTFTNTTSLDVMDRLFTCGDNSNYNAGLKSPKFTTELQVLWEYSPTNSLRQMDGSLFSKKLQSVDCMASCIACTKDGLVFVKKMPSWGWTAVSIPSGLFDSQGYNVSEKCKKVSVGGTVSKDTYFVLTESGHIFSWGEYNGAMRGYDDAEDSGLSPHLISTIFGAFDFAAFKDYDVPNNDGMGAMGFLNDTGLFMVGTNSYGMFGITPDDSPYLIPFLAVDSLVVGSKLKKIVFGYANVLVLSESGNVYGFGGNEYGQVIPESISTYETFRQITEVNGSSDCFCSGHACACIQAGSVKSWGNDKERGREGSTNFDYITFAEPMSVFSLLSSGGFFISTSNNVYSWGNNTYGYLCMGDKTIQLKPKLLFSTNYELKQLVSGNSCSYSLGESGGESIVNMWGNCTNGLGFGITPSGGYSFYNLTTLNKSTQLKDLKYSQLSMYNIHAGFLSTSPQMIGSGDSMRLGDSNATDLSTLFNVDTSILVSDEVIQVSAGYDHTLYLTKNGYLMGSGTNDYKQLIDDVYSNSFYSLVNISTTDIDTAGEKIVKVAAGKKTTFVLTNAGSVWAKGFNGDFQIQNGGESTIPNFVKLYSTNTLNITKLAVGNCAFMCENGGFAYIFKNGQFQYFSAYLEKCVDVFANGDIYYFISDVGKVYAVGPNDYYQISTTYGLDATTLTANMIFSAPKLGGIPKLISVGNGFTTIGVAYPSFTCNGKNFSHPTVCNGRGYCIGQDKCQCEESYWTGSDCNEPICIRDEGGQICSGKGVCNGPNTCACNEGYYGNQCGTYYCFGKSSFSYGEGTKPCNNRGNCIAPDTCQCSSPEYYGAECQFKRCFSENGSYLKKNTLADRLCNKINSQILDIPYPTPTGNMTDGGSSSGGGGGPIIRG